MSRWSDFQALNVERCLLWHPGGLHEWDRSDWCNALVGEYFEMVLAGWQSILGDEQEVHDEWADVMIYALTFDSSERGNLGAALDSFTPTKRPFGGGHANSGVVDALAELTSMVKESCRDRDGVASKGIDPNDLTSRIEDALRSLCEHLLDYAAFCRFDGLVVVGDKFNRTSDKFGFPQKWAPGGGS